jgi:hypothetical protein
MQTLSVNDQRKLYRLLEVQETMSGKCPQNAIVGPQQFLSAFGKTEVEAKANVDKQLRAVAKKIREDKNSPCEGGCDAGDCLLVATVDDKNGYHYHPAESRTKGEGYLCVYSGSLSAECVCAV